MVGAGAIFFRLFWAQVVVADRLQEIARRQNFTYVSIEPRRGTIYDREGRPLTTDLADYVKLGIDPRHVIRQEDLIKDLVKETGRSPKYFRDKLTRKAVFVELARKVSPEAADRLDSKGWNLTRQPDTRRFYPLHSFGANLIGFTDVDNRGIAGIELACEPILAGKAGSRMVQLDAKGKIHLSEGLPYERAIDGIDVALTIDLPIQTLVEEELIPAVTESHASSASALVIDPKTAQVLALAVYPTYDLNDPDGSPLENQKARPICDINEPGSTMKLVAAAMLLDNNTVKPTSMVDVSAGQIVVANRVIRDASNHGIIPFQDVVAFSSNVGIIKLTQPVTQVDLYRMIQRFGFLRETGIEIGGEASGMLAKPENWNGLTKANVVIGQGVGVTMLQMAMAYASIANGGVLMRPSLILGRYATDGSLIEEPAMEVGRVVSAKTAKTLTEAFVQVVEKGTAQRAKIEGIKIAGKTGTAQKTKPNGGYFQDRFVASFVGYFPAEDPQYVVMVQLDDPRGEMHQGGQVAAPIFKLIAERIIGLKPELRNIGRKTNKREAQDLVLVPDLRNQSAEKAAAALRKLGLVLKANGDEGTVRDQFPAYGARVPKGEQVELTFGTTGSKDGKVLVPILTGLSVRDAIHKATASGLLFHIKGNGKIVSQSPPSGASVKIGDVLTLIAEG
jgi:cell division protein FtsI/penicillin-binding protein 2